MYFNANDASSPGAGGPGLRDLPTRRLRVLDLAAPLDDGRRFVAAASGLALTGGRLVVVGDDLAHVASFTEDPAEPGTAHRVLPDVLPAGHAERKRRKPDLEALTALPASPVFPHGALLAVGSGSTAARERAVLIPLDVAGAPAGEAVVRDLAAVLAPLRAHRDEVNVEAALVLGDELVLVSRGHSAMPENLVARFALAAIAAWADGATSALAPRSVIPWRVGEIDGVPLGVTDAAAHPDGGWVFSAAAEDTSDAYADGAVAGAVVGRVDGTGAVVALGRLTPTAKVEGILARPAAGGTALLMVTDADDPDTPASLLAALLPG